MLRWFLRMATWLGVALSAEARLVVVGDLHADLAAALTIFADAGLVDREGRWIGGSARLVLLGDLIDRGTEPRELLDLVMGLQAAAKTAGGRVDALLGNHELDTAGGTFRALPEAFEGFQAGAEPGWEKELAKREERILSLANRKVPGWRQKYRSVSRAYGGDSKYARWIRELPAVLQIGDDLFVHAGLNERFARASPQGLNAMMRAWMLFLQGSGPRPDEATEWVVGEEGPLFDRTLGQLEETPVEASKVRDWLRGLGARRVFVGHSATESREVESKFGGQVVLCDTKIELAHKGRGTLSWVEVEPSGVARPHKADPSRLSDPWIEGVRQAIRGRWEQPVSPPPSRMACLRAWWGGLLGRARP